jgi:histidinol dehydrogenase
LAVADEVGPKWPNCTAVLTRSIDEAMEVSNRMAPEHLWLSEAKWLPRVTSAGSVFLGVHSPVAAGDYASGPNHTLPTSGAARLRGGLSVTDFLKVVTVQQLTPRGLAGLAPAIISLARAEGLENHARSIEVRLG